MVAEVLSEGRTTESILILNQERILYLPYAEGAVKLVFLILFCKSMHEVAGVDAG